MIDSVIAVAAGLVLAFGTRLYLDPGADLAARELAIGDPSHRGIAGMFRLQHRLVVTAVAAVAGPLELGLPVVGSTVVKLGIVLLGAAIVPAATVAVVATGPHRVPLTAIMTELIVHRPRPER